MIYLKLSEGCLVLAHIITQMTTPQTTAIISTVRTAAPAATMMTMRLVLVPPVSDDVAVSGVVTFLVCGL